MKLGSELATLTAGIDRLYRATPRSDGFLNREGLIPVSLVEIRPQELRDYDEATDLLLGLEARLAAEADGELRRAYLAEMIDSLLALVTTFQEKPISFAERLRRQIRVDTQMIDDRTLDGYRREIRSRLDALGYRDGDLAGDVRRWESDAGVRPDAVIDVLARYTREARRRSNALVADIGDDWLEPVGVTAMPFSAYCDYEARKLLLNLDFPYTTFALKHLACHEAFPGHLLHLALRERGVRDGTLPLDHAQVVTSSASSALFEGIGDNGLSFLNWIETPGDELAVYLQRLRSALRCNAAWMVHMQGRTIEDVAPLIATAGFQDPATSKSRLSFLKHDLRTPFVYAYWCGEEAVAKTWRSIAVEDRTEFMSSLYGNMHTLSTLAAAYP